MTFPNGKLYVGQTRRALSTRVRAHRAAMRCGVRSPIYHAWRKHGEPVASVLMDSVPDADMDARECEWIARLNTRSRKVGYNATAGGDKVFDRTGYAAHNRGAAHDARARGDSTYESSRPCPLGHVGLRYSANSSCVQCALGNNRTAEATARKKKYRDKSKKKAKQYAKRPEVVARRRAWAAKWRVENRAKIRAYHLEYQRAYRARKK